MQPTVNLATTAKATKIYFCLFTKTELTRLKSVTWHASENYYLATDKVSAVLLNLSLEFVEIVGQLLEGRLLEFRFEGGVLFPVIKEHYKNKLSFRFLRHQR